MSEPLKPKKIALKQSLKPGLFSRIQMVLSHVRRLGVQKLKILNSIVSSYTVKVMHNFLPKQLTTKCLLHHNSMLKVDTNVSISIPPNPTTLKIRMVLTNTLAQITLLTPFRFVFLFITTRANSSTFPIRVVLPREHYFASTVKRTKSSFLNSIRPDFKPFSTIETFDKYFSHTNTLPCLSH